MNLARVERQKKKSVLNRRAKFFLYFSLSPKVTPPLTHLQQTQHTLHPYTPHILPPPHIPPQITPHPPSPPNPLPQRLRPHNKQLPHRPQHLQPFLKPRIHIPQLPAPQQLAVLANVLGHHDAAGGIDLEFFKVLEEEVAGWEGEFEEEGGEVWGGGGEGFQGEGVEAGEECCCCLAGLFFFAPGVSSMGFA